FYASSSTHIYTLSLHDALPISRSPLINAAVATAVPSIIDLKSSATKSSLTDSKQTNNDSQISSAVTAAAIAAADDDPDAEEPNRSEEHTSELQSRSDLVCRLLL